MNHNKLIDLDTVVSESEINVINTMFDYYNKAYLFIENYHGDVEDCCNILQEQLIMESVTKNETKNKKSLLKRLLDLLSTLVHKAIDNIKKYIIDPIRSAFKKSKNSNNKISEIQIEEPVKIDDIITFTNKLLNIDIFRNDIDVDKFDDELYAIFEEKGGMTSIDKLCNKMEYITKTIKQIETKINDINKRVDEVDNFNDDGQYVSQLYNFCMILKRLLSEYINLTKDINSKIKESESSNKNIIDDKYKNGPYCVRYKKGESEPMNPDLEDKIFKLGLICRSTNDYGEYKSAYDELCDILGFPRDAVCMPGSSSRSALKNGYFLWRINSVREKETLTLKPGTKLYHTSSIKGLTELKPSFRAIAYSDADCDAMYPTQRVYFFLKNPGKRFDTSNAGKFKRGAKDYVYEYIVNSPMKVKIDTEATHGSYRKAVFIETDTPIPVKDVTEEFKD